MASNDNVKVFIVGDASGVQPAVEQAAGSIGSLEPLLAELNANMKALTAQMAEGFTAGAAGARQLATGMEEAKVASTGLGASIKATVLQIHEGAEAVRTFQMRAKAFAELYVGIFAVQAIAHGIENVVGATTEWTQANLKLSQSLGVSLERASGLHVTLNKLGISTDQITNASQRLVRQLKIHENAINDLGIQTRDANGHFRDSLDIITDSMSRLSEYKAGVDRTAAAQKLFGRGAGDLTSMLRLTNEQMQEGARVAHELGLVTTVEGVQAMRNYEDATKEAKEVIEALKIALGDALLPVLTDLANWMRANGKQAVETFVAAIRGEIDGIHLLILNVREAIAQLHLWGAEFNLLSGLVDIFVERMIGEWNLLGKVLGEIPHWSQMKADWESGMAALDASTTAHMNHIVGEVESARAAIAGLDAQIAGLERKPGKGQDTLGNPFGLGQFTGKPEPIAGAGGDNRLDDLKDPKSKKGSTKDDLVQKLAAELEAKKAAWEKEQLAQDTAEQFSLQSEADFWDQALKRTDLSAKDRFEITKKWIAAEQALQSDRIAAVLDGDKRELFEADKNAQAKLAIVEKEAAFIKRTYGDQSKEARQADFAVLQAQREAADQQIQMINAVAKARLDADNVEVDEAEKNAELKEQLGLITHGKLLQQERQFEQQRYQIDLAALIQRRSLIDPNRDPVAYQAVNLQIEALERQHQQKLTQIDRQAVLQRTSLERQGIQQVAASTADHISKMITLQEGWREGLVGIYQGLVQTVASVLEQIIEKWIAAFLIKLILGKQEAAQSTANYVGQAGAGGVASMAAAPFPINLTAPAFGASMAAAAAAFGSVASAEGGDWNVREGLYKLHTDEMVLPAWAASPLRAMVMNPAESGGGHGKSGGGDIHLHNSPVFNGNQGSLWQHMVDQHGREMRRWIKREASNGTFSKEAA